jgi:putative heme-binding domain-containing protein
LRLLHRLAGEPPEAALRGQLVTLITNSLKQPIKVTEPAAPDATAIRRAYQPLFDYITAKYPGLGRAMNAEDNDDPGVWSKMLGNVPWNLGDAARGGQIYTQRACAGCHSEAGAIGPSLAGAAQRFAREDLMNAIVFPSRDIAPPYRTTTFRMRNGESHTGIVAFESADGWLVQTGAGLSVRLDSRDVVTRHPGTTSVMPSGLLTGLNARELADLYAYLRTLEARRVAASLSRQGAKGCPQRHTAHRTPTHRLLRGAAASR